MNLLVRFIVVAAAVAFIVIAGSGTHADPAKPTDKSVVQSDPHGDAKAVGSAGCSGSNCHGGAPSDKPADMWKSSYTAFMGHDKHTQAWDVLNNDRSKEIVKSWSHGTQKDATHVWQCLACHSNPTLAMADNATPAVRQLQSEGVSCESCHGNASKYLHAHTGWLQSGESRLGMTGLNSIDTRAHTCAGCHVGAPADPVLGLPLRDVTHDMIAAGHPRLNFEFASYSRLMPPHWWERDRRKNDADHAKNVQEWSWSIGQHASAIAHLRLLDSRLNSASAERWPEFAEFNCYACHHDLQPASWRRELPKLTPGSLIWNRPGIRSAAGPLSAELDAVENALAKSLTTKDSSPHKAVVKAVRQFAAGQSSPAAAFLNLTDAEWQNLDWDQAARVYAAGVAMAQSKLNNPEVVAAIESLHCQLKFTNGIDSPAKYTPAKTRDKLREFIKMVR